MTQLLKIDVEMPLDGARRQQIQEAMSNAMGSAIEGVGDTDFANWSAEQWMNLVGVAFDVAAHAVFSARVAVHGPRNVHSSEIPF